MWLLFFLVSCAFMAQDRMDSLDCLVRALLDQVTVNLEAWPFTSTKMEAKTLMCDIRERIEEEQCRSAGHCSIVYSCIYT